MQLHWSEYLGGEWTTRESGGYSEVITQTVPASFTRNRVFIHVSKEYDPGDGAELGVFVHMGGEINRAFYLAGRNSAPESARYRSKPANPFSSANTTIANRYSGSGALDVSYWETVSTEPGKTPPKANRSILLDSLQAGVNYTLLPCNMDLSPLGVSEIGVQKPRRVMNNFGYGARGWRVEQHPRFLADLTGDGRADIVGFGNAGVYVALNKGDGTFRAPQLVVPNFGYGAGGWRVDRHPRFLADLTGDGRADIVGFGNAGVYVATGYYPIEAGLKEIATLIKPVFYQDNRHTFFVEPEVVERTIEEWEEWVTRTMQPELTWQVSEITVISKIPHKSPIPYPDDLWRFPIDPGSVINPVLERDWLVNPGTVMKFGDVLIGPIGQPSIEIQSESNLAVSQRLVNVNPGSNLAGGSSVALQDERLFASSGLQSIRGGLNIVGGAGFNSALQKNFTDMNRSDFGAGAPGVGRI